MYSRLNNCHQRKFGSKLQKWPRLSNQLKSYEAGYVRTTAKIFSRQEIYQALQLNLTTPYWILRKCAITLAYSGGLRCIELKSIKYGNVTQDDEGIWVKYVQAKQRGEQKDNRFLVPFERNNPQLCLASRVVTYLRGLEQSHPNLKADEDLFKQCLKDGFGKHSMGKNVLAQVGKEVATQLGLDVPEKYTGHCFRRSYATEAANQGGNSSFC